MTNFKHINVIKHTKYEMILETSDEKSGFTLSFVLKDNKIHTSLTSVFDFSGVSLWDRIKEAYNLIFKKNFKMNNTFNFKNGLHVVNVSDALFIMSRNIKKE